MPHNFSPLLILIRNRIKADKGAALGYLKSDVKINEKGPGFAPQPGQHLKY
jgi:hypothetical protein